jgi:hypothetical protein
MAKVLGRRGGRARARRLSAADRKRIASLGGHARRRSLEAAQRIITNLRHARMVALMRGTPRVRRMKTCAGPLPGLPPDRPRDV